jgi:hypothetical protein
MQKINKEIENLLSKYQWPGINAITFANGKITLLDVEFYSNNSYYIAPILDSTIESYLNYNEEYLSSFDIFSTVNSESYNIFVGDGSGEGNGTIYVKNRETDSLIWFAFFENSEPFTHVELSNDEIISATSTLGIKWELSIKNPLKITLKYPQKIHTFNHK